jgi:indole-3-acetate O-methyltransferase
MCDGIEAVPGIKVIECIERVVRCPYRETWTSGKSTKTAREHAEWFVPTTKTWSNSTFKAALKADRADKDEIVAKFWNNYVDLVEANPDAHGMDYVHCYLVVEKE